MIVVGRIYNIYNVTGIIEAKVSVHHFQGKFLNIIIYKQSRAKAIEMDK